jgi:rhodanese-related sulfurtransferase
MFESYLQFFSDYVGLNYRFLMIISTAFGFSGFLLSKYFGIRKRLFITLQFFFFALAGIRLYIDNATIKSLNICNQQYVLVNVLGKEEFDDCAIKNSIHVAFDKIPSFLETLILTRDSKDKPLIFYCSNYFCTSSDEAAKMAVALGFKQVYVYKGGMAEWYQLSQKDPSYEYQGNGKADYLKLIILKRDFINEEKFKIITAEELKKLINLKIF